METVERNRMLETHGDYGRPLQASKNGANKLAEGQPRNASSQHLAPHYREYRPDKWLGRNTVLNFTNSQNCGSAPNTHHHDYVDKPDNTVRALPAVQQSFRFPH